MSVATLKQIRLECYLSRLPGANKVSLFRADSLDIYLLQCAWDLSVVAMDKTYLIQGVPLAIEPGMSLIILKPMKILQRDLNGSTFVV
jgi:hypothetical protein